MPIIYGLNFSLIGDTAIQKYKIILWYSILQPWDILIKCPDKDHQLLNINVNIESFCESGWFFPSFEKKHVLSSNYMDGSDKELMNGSQSVILLLRFIRSPESGRLHRARKWWGKKWGNHRRITRFITSSCFSVHVAQYKNISNHSHNK